MALKALSNTLQPCLALCQSQLGLCLHDVLSVAPVSEGNCLPTFCKGVGWFSKIKIGARIVGACHSFCLVAQHNGRTAVSV